MDYLKHCITAKGNCEKCSFTGNRQHCQSESDDDYMEELNVCVEGQDY